MRESKITTIFKGEYVQVDMVDETIELTVENNVYSRSESLELLDELQKACAVSKSHAEPFDSKAKLHDETDVASSGRNAYDDSGYYNCYPNHLPRLIKEIEDRKALKDSKDIKND